METVVSLYFFFLPWYVASAWLTVPLGLVAEGKSSSQSLFLALFREGIWRRAWRLAPWSRLSSWMDLGTTRDLKLLPALIAPLLPQLQKLQDCADKQNRAVVCSPMLLITSLSVELAAAAAETSLLLISHRIGIICLISMTRVLGKLFPSSCTPEWMKV